VKTGDNDAPVIWFCLFAFVLALVFASTRPLVFLRGRLCPSLWAQRGSRRYFFNWFANKKNGQAGRGARRAWLWKLRA